MCDPTGFQYFAMKDGVVAGMMGDELAAMGDEGVQLRVEFPVQCGARVLRDGEEVWRTEDQSITMEGVAASGAYRVEGWLEVDGEKRPWIYSNPIYIR